FDLRTAEKATCLGAPTVVAQIGASGNRLDFCNQNGQVTYQLTGTQMSRTANGVTKIYNQNVTPELNVLCPGGCFQIANGQLQIPDLRVQQANAGNSIIDQWFA